jgi:hypothetical protein
LAIVLFVLLFSIVLSDSSSVVHCIVCPKEEGQTIQWTKEEGSDNTMDKRRRIMSYPSSFVLCIV